jgi:hypothetical protein
MISTYHGLLSAKGITLLTTLTIELGSVMIRQGLEKFLKFLIFLTPCLITDTTNNLGLNNSYYGLLFAYRLILLLISLIELEKLLVE